MRSELEKIEYIEQYLEGKLTAEQKVAFENEMDTDADFKADVELQKNVVKAVRKNALKSTLNEIHAAKFGGKTKKVWWKKVWLNVLVIGLLTAAGIALLNDGEANSESYFVERLSQESEKEIAKEVIEDTSSYDFDCGYDPTEESSASVNSSALTEKEHGRNRTSDPLIDSLTLAEQETAVIVDVESRLDLTGFTTQFDTILYKQGKSSVFNYSKSKTKIVLPANLIANGIAGEQYQLIYREYRNSAEIAFSDIPMTYEENGEEFLFNSVGMFEFRAVDTSLKMNEVAKSKLSIDFEQTQNIGGVAFYGLKKNVWEKQKVFTEVEGTTLNYVLFRTIDDIPVSDEDYEEMRISYNILRNSINEALIRFSVKNRLQLSNSDFVLNMDGSYTLSKGFSSFFKQSPEILQEIEVYKNDIKVKNERFKNNKVERERAITKSTKGHAISNIIQGLRLNGFGVYNCDQQYRLKNRVERVVRIDGVEDEDIDFVKLIDLKINSAFSFAPSALVMNKASNNVLLVFTGKRLLFIKPKEMAMLANNKNHELLATDISDVVVDSKQLFQMLKSYN